MKSEILKTERLILRPLEEKDRERLFPLFSKKSVEDYCHQAKRPEDIDQWLDYALKQNVVPWIMEVDKKPVGIIDICLMEDDEPYWEAGYMVDIDYQGRGYAAEGLYYGLKWCIDKLGADNIEAGITIHNLASRRVVEKLGFELKKTVEKDWNWNGVLYDSVYYYLNRNSLIKPV